jgi:hypothetical protein
MRVDAIFTYTHGPMRSDEFKSKNTWMLLLEILLYVLVALAVVWLIFL